MKMEYILPEPDDEYKQAQKEYLDDFRKCLPNQEPDHEGRREAYFKLEKVFMDKLGLRDDNRKSTSITFSFS